jgi:membrane protease YdiL (CAAX protease family)
MTAGTSLHPLPSPRVGPRWAVGSNASLFHALGIVVLLMGLHGVGLGVVAPAILEDGFAFEGRPLEFILVGLMMAVAAGLVVGIALCLFGRISLSSLGWDKSGMTREVGVGVIAFAACAVLLVALTAFTGGSADIRSLVTTMGSYTIAQRLLFLLIGLGAAFNEESIFRGYLQPVVISKAGRAGGIALTAGIFALHHMQFSPPQFAGRFGLGLVYGVLRARRGSLVAPATAHLLVWVVIGSA